MKRDKSQAKYLPIIVSIALYNKLNKQNKEHIVKAEKGNEDSLLYVSKNFITGGNDFPEDKDIGIKYLIYGTEQNITKAIEEYGTLLLKGEIIPKDEEKAIILLNKVATIRNDPLQKLSLVDIILSHQSYDINSTANLEVNYVLAKQICKEAADLGNAKAMREYGILCTFHQINKYGVIKANFSEAFKYMTMSAEKGDPEAMYRLGTFYEYGLGGIEINNKKAKEMYKKSFEEGNVEGCAFYGYSLVDEKFGEVNEKEGLKLIKYSCDKQCPTGINTYGFVIDCGLAGFEKDEEKAFRYYQKAAKLGNYSALNNIGTYYRDGTVVQQDINLALKYFVFVLDRGFVNAAHNIGNVYSDPQYGIPVNREKASFYFRIGINNGSRMALIEYCWFLVGCAKNDSFYSNELKKYFDIGRKMKEINTMRLQAALIYDGDSIFEKNHKLAIEIFKECADLGCKDSMEYLVSIFENGDFDVEVDEVQAQKYKNMIENLENK